MLKRQYNETYWHSNLNIVISNVTFSQTLKATYFVTKTTSRQDCPFLAAGGLLGSSPRDPSCWKQSVLLCLQAALRKAAVPGPTRRAGRSGKQAAFPRHGPEKDICCHSVSTPPISLIKGTENSSLPILTRITKHCYRLTHKTYYVTLFKKIYFFWSFGLKVLYKEIAVYCVLYFLHYSIGI